MLFLIKSSQEAKTFFRSIQTEETDIAFQTCNIPSLQKKRDIPLNETDILANFKANHLVEDSFHLTQDETNLILELFKYPLDAKMTLFDLLGFDLFSKMENLKSINIRFNEKITKTQGLLSVYCLSLFIGLNRSGMSALGPINANSEKYMVFPHTFPVLVNKCLQNFLQAIEDIKPLSKKTIPIQKEELIRKKKELRELFKLNVLPVRDLFYKLLQCKGHYELLLQSASKFHCQNDLNKDHPDGRAFIERYCAYIKIGNQIGSESKSFPLKLPIDLPFNGNVLPFSTPPHKKEMASFGLKIAKATHFLYAKRMEYRNELTEAIDGKLEQHTWLERNNLRLVKKKNPQEFKEHLFSMVALTYLGSLFFSDMLQLIEKRVYPKGTITTESCFFRLRHNMHMVMISPPIDSTSSCLLPGAIPLKFNKIVERIQSEFKQCPELFNYARSDEDIQRGDFIYGKWLDFLLKMEEKPKNISISSLLESSLSTLMTLKEEIIQDLKKEWSTLSLEDLKKLDAAAMKEAIFQEGLKLLRPLLILVDMLALLQKRHFSEEAAIIPKELAEIMELDEIEEMLDRLIQAKTALQPPPVEQPLPAPGKIVSAMEGNLQATVNALETEPEPLVNLVKTDKVPAVKRASKKREPSPEPNEEAAPPAMPEEIRELADLTKSRKILAKLKALNFNVVRQTGSHQILNGPQGGTVVLPNNDELQEGTRRSILEQATNALLKTRK